jgi:ribosome-binding protein aMBF1 (putative translation factor)
MSAAKSGAPVANGCNPRISLRSIRATSWRRVGRTKRSALRGAEWRNALRLVRPARCWMKSACYRREYDALKQEFFIIAAIANARRRAGLSQAELARRMKTTQSTVARLESGRSQPSTRTLARFAKATGHRLRISFQPVKGKG